MGVRLLLGWESGSVETASALAARLVAERYAWKLGKVVQLLLALRTSEAEHDSDLSPWDAADLSLVSFKKTKNHTDKGVWALPFAPCG